MALIASLAILWLSRGFNFYFDEWTFILTAPDWSWTTYLEPHNEHPAILPRLIYAVLLSTVGLRSYLPYMAVLLVLHAASAWLLFELVRRRAGDLLGVAAPALLLVLGAGWENLLWAFQMTFVGAVALGLGALLAMETRRTGLAVALLAGAIMFSGIGLFFGVAVVVRLGLTPERRKELLWLAPVVVAFGVWYLAFGRTGLPPNPPPTAGNIALLPAYVAWGLGSAVAGIIGEGGWVGLVLLVAASLAVGRAWRRQGMDPFALGVAAGLLALYVATGLTRAQLGYQQSGSGRYVYEGVIFWLLLLADAARDLPWRGTWRPASIACLFLACFSSAALLFSFAIAKTAQMQRENADLQALAAARGYSCLNLSGVADPLVMPQVASPALYYRAVDRYGSPLASSQITDPADFERAAQNLTLPNCP
jgi:hypothetical protein